MKNDKTIQTLEAIKPRMESNPLRIKAVKVRVCLCLSLLSDIILETEMSPSPEIIHKSNPT